MENSIGVFGQDVLLWASLLMQSPQRPHPQQLYQHANYLLDELKREGELSQVPMQSAQDGMFAIAALIDEFAMALPDVRPFWSQTMLQAQRFGTNNAGVEVFERLQRVRQAGPPSVVATFAVVLGLGFQGCYSLPGADRYQLAQTRRDLAAQLGVDPDRDWDGGTLRTIRPEEVENLEMFDLPWYKTANGGRIIAGSTLGLAILTLIILLATHG